MKKLALALLILAACDRTTYNYYVSSQPAQPSASVSLGCFLDAPARVLPAFLLQSSTTVENCQLLATQAGYKYSGVEYGTQCFAGNTLPTQTATNCNMSCAADQAEICGGTWALNVYATGL